jgi:cell division inhibitor SepF
MATVWRKTLAYLGLVEDYEDEYADLPEEPPMRAQRPTAPPMHVEPAPRTDPTNVRRISPARHEPPPSFNEPSRTVNTMPSGKVHVTEPSTFNDIEEVGDRFRNGIPVIMNLAGASESVAKRLLDFASGLIYGLDGRIERVGDRVFLLTPSGVDVSTEERRKLSERGFFNQA